MTGPQHHLRFQALLQREGWVSPAFVALDAAGRVTSVADTPPANPASAPQEIAGFAIPGFQNAHSHSFQYAMAGLAEHSPHGASLDDFWKWREALYNLALRISPEQLRAVAAMVYSEMLRHGVTAVAEFHYVHHDLNGAPHQDLALMGKSLLAAAADAGIHLTLVPVRYALSSFNTAAMPEQRRFLCPTQASYQRLLEATRAAAHGMDDTCVGLGVHSLRAVDSEDVKALLNAPFQGPAHLHVAEQQREVTECEKALKRRPVAWVLENLPVDSRFNLVHATLMVPRETRDLARSGATVVICPSTEANLGDGFFSFNEYLKHGGHFTTGSDSQVSLNPLEELRWLDYGERLRQRKRLVLGHKPGDDGGAMLFDAAWTSGRTALGLKNSAYFAIGEPFDAVVLDPEHPVLVGRAPERRLASLIYAGDPSCYLGVMRRGRWLVQGQKHKNATALRAGFRAAVQELAATAP